MIPPRPVADGLRPPASSVNGLVLVTRNVRDFARFSGLEVEDWFE